MIYEFVKFIIYSSVIVLISKYVLVKTLRKLAENLNLKPKTVGNVAGYATSMPELLTIVTASLRGLQATSIYNILSSNIINFIQYAVSIISNKNTRVLKNVALKLEIFLVILTIIIPIVLIKLDINIDLSIVPILILLFLLFIYVTNNAHKVYLKEIDKKIEEDIKKEEIKEAGNTRKTLLYVFILIIVGIILFVVGDLLGETLENLATKFNIPQVIIGILLGITTSIPELITFFEAQNHYEKEEENILGVVEATNNLLTSNISNLFVIQTIGISIINMIK